MSLLWNLVGLDVNTVVAPSETSPAISKTSIGNGPPSSFRRADAIEREAKASGGWSILGNISEECTINRFRKDADEKQKMQSEG
jgi:hypothetical protein